MCQIILSIPDEVLYDTKMSHEQVNQFARQAYFLKRRCEIFSVNLNLL